MFRPEISDTLVPTLIRLIELSDNRTEDMENFLKKLNKRTKAIEFENWKKGLLDRTEEPETAPIVQEIYNMNQPTPVFRSPQPTNVPSEPSEPSKNESA